MIIAQNLSKVYNNSHVKTIALQNIDLKIQTGSFVAIIGPSGSGKSTLIHILAGLDKPTKEEEQLLQLDNYTILGKTESSLAEFRARNVGFVLQFFGLLPTLTVLENVMMAGYFGGIKDKVRKAKALELLSLVGLENRVNHLPSQLSGGQKQRVAIARALINSPKILFADEPTGNLDSTSGREILELLKKLNLEQGITIIVVSHDSRILDYCTEIIEIEDGKIISHISNGNQS
ncbi:MAG: ABC transporter ATP-binding protein [Asgard group archaeon]|nr:ABC transporter ATP-binding protein [Asgard group archaeon]